MGRQGGELEPLLREQSAKSINEVDTVSPEQAAAERKRRARVVSLDAMRGLTVGEPFVFWLLKGVLRSSLAVEGCSRDTVPRR